MIYPTAGNFIPIGGQFAPSDPATDLYPIVDAFFIKDGLRVVKTTAERNAITTARRRAGMIVGVGGDDGIGAVDEYVYYRLKNITPWLNNDDDWEVWNISGSITNKQVAFGDADNKISSGADLMWDYDVNKLSIKGSVAPDLNILEILNNASTPILTVDTSNTIKLYGTTSGYVGFRAAVVSTDTIYYLPPADGSPGQYLSTDGSGNLNWSSVTAGGIGYAATITGDGSQTEWTITHLLNTEDILVQAYYLATKITVDINVLRSTTDDAVVELIPALALNEEVRVLIFSVVPGTVTGGHPGGMDTDIQYNKNGVFGGESNFQYKYSNLYSSKYVDLTVAWGSNRTTGQFAINTLDRVDGVTKRPLVILKSVGIGSPIYTRGGVLELYNSSSPSVLRVELNASVSGTPYLQLNDNNSTITANISRASFLPYGLTIGTTTFDTSASLTIKALTGATSLMIKDEANDPRLWIYSNGHLETKDGIGLRTSVLQAGTEGDVRYNYTTKFFQGKTDTQWVNFHGGGVPAEPLNSIQFHNTGGVFGGNSQYTYEVTPPIVTTHHLPSHVALSSNGFSGQLIDMTGTYSTAGDYWTGLKIQTNGANVTNGNFKAISVASDRSGISGLYNTYFSYTGYHLVQSYWLQSTNASARGLYINLTNTKANYFAVEEYGIQTIITGQSGYLSTLTGHYNEVNFNNYSVTTGSYILLDAAEEIHTNIERRGLYIDCNMTLNDPLTTLAGIKMLHIDGTSIVDIVSGAQVIGLNIDGAFKYGIKSILTPTATAMVSTDQKTFITGYYNEVQYCSYHEDIKGQHINIKGLDAGNIASTSNIYGLYIDSTDIILNFATVSYHGIYISGANLTDTLHDMYNGISIIDKFTNSLYIHNNGDSLVGGCGAYIKVDSATAPVITAEANSYLFELIGGIVEAGAPANPADTKVKVKYNGLDYYLSLSPAI